MRVLSKLVKAKKRMELKQSKRLLLLLFLFVFTYSYAQDEELILDPDSIDYTDNNEYFSEDRHYYPEEFSSFQNQNHPPHRLGHRSQYHGLWLFCTWESD